MVFLTPYEHHSNILPWVEFYEKIEVLSGDDHGCLILKDVEKQLKNSPSKNIIVSISAASNVTSYLTDLKAFNALISKLFIILEELRKEKNVIFAVDCAAFCCHHDLGLKIYD